MKYDANTNEKRSRLIVKIKLKNVKKDNYLPAFLALFCEKKQN